MIEEKKDTHEIEDKLKNMCVQHFSKHEKEISVQIDILQKEIQKKYESQMRQFSQNMYGSYLDKQSGAQDNKKAKESKSDEFEMLINRKMDKDEMR